jgi:hypothetical protein
MNRSKKKPAANVIPLPTPSTAPFSRAAFVDAVDRIADLIRVIDLAMPAVAAEDAECASMRALLFEAVDRLERLKEAAE